MKLFAETETITKVQFGVRTTTISQIFGVNESAVTCDMQNLIFAVWAHMI
jgi:hypothetical protein